ncbi:hypothetical protein [Nocardioides sp. CFH 31398]|uniref:hypothetical protein n=1 Tax=Nocardioides sp. CFH 31398 TaxID=2919579 RepID=UPI001F05D192|nr:hypothetical protein [Nocardioides sp. CFH 31398]MCH1866005.1 hypothetical protein [Nocardioides sp. CFH 31398]
MKKFAASVIVALLMSAGLVAASSTTASAAPYPPRFETSCNATSQGSVNRFERPSLRVNVRPRGTNRSPRGTVTVNYVRREGGKRVSYTRGYNGPTVYSFPALRRPGRYYVVIRYNPGANSVFKSCSDTANQFVRNRPRG